jgi:hypothetical protein
MARQAILRRSRRERWKTKPRPSTIADMEPAYQEPAKPSGNGMGVAGFIVSLVGLILCAGIICPLGLVFSLIGLGREPRGLAIAGTILGGLGTLVFLGLVAVFLGVGEMKETMVTGVRFAMVQVEIEQYHKEHGEFPDADDGNEMIADELDGWDRPIRYSRTGTGYQLQSAGPDGEFDTADDIKHP